MPRSIKAPRQPSRATLLARRVVPPAIAFLIVYLLWEFATGVMKVPPFLLPSPRSIAVALTETWGSLVTHGLFTIQTIVLGFLVSVAIGIPLAVLIAASPTLAAAIYPLLVMIQSIPKVALAPILIVAMGTSEAPRIVITFLVAFFPIIIASATGLMSTPPELIDLSRSLKSSKLQEMFWVRLPYAIPHIFSGLKVSATLAVIGVVVAEFVAADSGLGYLLLSSTAFFNTPLAYAAMLCLSVIAIVAFQLVVVVQSLMFGWSMRGQKNDGL